VHRLNLIINPATIQFLASPPISASSVHLRLRPSAHLSSIYPPPRLPPSTLLCPLGSIWDSRIRAIR
jgi:hypothetical protein